MTKILEAIYDFNDHKSMHGGHIHHHHHDHDHSHESTARLRWAFWLNLIFCFIELAGGIWTNSLSVLADALHDFGDALALGIAYFLEKKSHQKSDAKYSYGFRRFSVLSALIMGVILLFGSVAIFYLSWQRFQNPQDVHSPGMIGIAVLGILANGIALAKLKHGHSMNEKMATLHLFEDLMGWVIVLVGAIVIQFTGWSFLDSFLALAPSVWVLWNVFRNFRQVLGVFLQAVPAGISIDTVQNRIKQLPGVADVHHSHVWSIDGESHIFTAHVVLKQVTNWSEVAKLKADVKHMLKKEFHIREATIEIERSGEDCKDPHHH